MNIEFTHKQASEPEKSFQADTDAGLVLQNRVLSMLHTAAVNRDTHLKHGPYALHDPVHNGLGQHALHGNNVLWSRWGHLLTC